MRRVVITGIGATTPLGTGIPAFFDGLRAARSGIDRIRSFQADTFPTRIAGEVRDLDPRTLPLPAAERPALLRDRKSVFGLVAAREALTDAFGQERPDRAYPGLRLGVVVASGLEVFNLEDIAAHMPDGVLRGASLLASALAAPPEAFLQIPAHLAAQCIAREAGASGLFAVDVSACAAGTQAIGEAFLAIREGALDAAITGGYDSMVNPLGIGGFSMLGALSRSNELGAAASRPFDRRRDGFVLGEGAGMLVLEEASAARARGARIYAELLGYGSTMDAYRVSDPAPDQDAVVAAMRGALRDGGVAPEQIGYINAHGTGTPKNDPSETRAIRRVFGPLADRIPVSSTKSQTGHLIGAAGAVELIAGLFALEEDVLPATINLEEPDPECDLDYVPLTPRSSSIMAFISNSLGFGGQNASIVVGSPRSNP